MTSRVAGSARSTVASTKAVSALAPNAEQHADPDRAQPFAVTGLDEERHHGADHQDRLEPFPQDDQQRLQERAPAAGRRARQFLHARQTLLDGVHRTLGAAEIAGGDGAPEVREVALERRDRARAARARRRLERLERDVRIERVVVRLILAPGLRAPASPPRAGASPIESWNPDLAAPTTRTRRVAERQCPYPRHQSVHFRRRQVARRRHRGPSNAVADRRRDLHVAALGLPGERRQLARQLRQVGAHQARWTRPDAVTRRAALHP